MLTQIKGYRLRSHHSPVTGDYDGVVECYEASLLQPTTAKLKAGKIILKLNIMRTKPGESNVEKEKLDIIKWVDGLNDKDAIEKLRMLRDSPKKLDWWNEITDEEKSAIDKGMEDIKAGRIKPHREAKKIYEKWL